MIFYEIELNGPCVEFVNIIRGEFVVFNDWITWWKILGFLQVHENLGFYPKPNASLVGTSLAPRQQPLTSKPLWLIV